MWTHDIFLSERSKSEKGTGCRILSANHAKKFKAGERGKRSAVTSWGGAGGALRSSPQAFFCMVHSIILMPNPTDYGTPRLGPNVNNGL